MAYRENIPEKIRKKVLERDCYKCSICDSTDRLVVDHCYPYSQGGGNEMVNLRTLCWKHNAERNKYMKNYPLSLGRRVSKEVARRKRDDDELLRQLERVLEEKDSELEQIEHEKGVLMQNLDTWHKLYDSSEQNSKLYMNLYEQYLNFYNSQLKITTDFIQENNSLYKQNNELRKALSKEQNKGVIERLFYRFI